MKIARWQTGLHARSRLTGRVSAPCRIVSRLLSYVTLGTGFYAADVMGNPRIEDVNGGIALAGETSSLLGGIPSLEEFKARVPSWVTDVAAGFSETEIVMLSLSGLLLVAAITLAIQVRMSRARLRAEVSNHNRSKLRLNRGKKRLEALMHSSARANSPLSLEETLESIAREAAELLGAAGAGFRLLKGDQLIATAKHGLAAQIMCVDSVKVGDGLSGRVARLAEPVVVTNLGEEARCLEATRKAAQKYDSVSYVAVPMLDHDKKVAGVLMVCDSKQQSFSRAEVVLLRTCANHAIVAIEKTRLFEKARRHAVALQREVTERKQIEKKHEHIRRNNEQILNSSGDGIYGLDIEGRITFINPAAARMIGWEAEELIGKLQHEVLHRKVAESDSDGSYTCASCNAFKQGDVNRVDDEVFWRKDGSGFPVEYTSTPIHEGNKLVGTVVNFRDISARKHAERALQSSEHRYRILYDNNPSMYFTVDQEGVVLSVNPFGAKQLGFTSDELLGTSLFKLCHKADVTKTKQILQAAIRDSNQVHRCEIRMIGKKGDTLWARESVRLTTGANRQKVILIVCEDITEAHLLSDKLRHQATHDFLTGLVNRREFERRLQSIVENVREEIAEHVLCYLDLDQFKLINDLCGHNAGDHLLKKLSQILSKNLRSHDTLARLGGDEFGVILENCSIHDGEHIAEKLKNAVKAFQFIWEDKTMHVGVSIGLVAINHGIGRSETLLGFADAACYQAKQAGRNRIRVYRSTDTEELNRMSGDIRLRTAIEHALDKNMFHLAFQPIVPVLNNKKEGERYELLLRLKDEDGQYIPTPEIIRVAEQYGFATRIDQWVIRTGFEWLAKHPEHLDRLSLCFINLSAHSLGENKFLVSILDRFRETGIPQSKICFEVTETAAISNFSTAAQFIEVLTKFGCRFALDDFGSGLSSFAYLKNLAVDFIKIDGIFVKDLENDPISLAMVNSINEICHVTGKQTIAEFVENEATMQKLRDIGVDFAQGYGIGQPKPLSGMDEPRNWPSKVAVLSSPHLNSPLPDSQVEAVEVPMLEQVSR